MFYLLVIPVTIALLLELRHMLRLRKHDRVLFPICQIRRDLVAFVAAKYDAGELDRDDYIYARLMLNSVNSMISLYREHRMAMFNLRRFVLMLARYRQSAKQLILVPRTDTLELRQIEARLNRAMASGFFAYTPWLRTQFGAYIAMRLMALLAGLGLKFFAHRAQDLRDLLELVKEQAQQTVATTGEFRTA
jgi:hypothetical protein